MYTGLGFLAAASVVAGLVKRRRSSQHFEASQAERFRSPTTRLSLQPSAMGSPEQTPNAADLEAESADVWGFADTRFEVQADGCVLLTGSRYALCGQKLPHLVPWVRSMMDIELPLDDVVESHYPPYVAPSRPHQAFLAALQPFLSDAQISHDAATRLRHGHGHTQEEMWAIKHGEMGRVPDLVVYPEHEDQVVALVAAAKTHDVCLIPFGGGTSVTEALRCPADEPRVIASVDMRRMNRVLWIDVTNRMACIEAGAVGRELTATLAARGYTMGHEPDSIEFSTLGGWVATHASGMKKNKYGNIEDLVLDIRAVGPEGMLTRRNVAPRESVGYDTRRQLFGSEGSLGIITSAVVKLFELPPVKQYGSILFPSFEQGVAFMYELSQSHAWPASVRLVDNVQFQFSMALKPQKKGLKKFISRAEKFYVTKLRGLAPHLMTACTLVFEGTAEEVAAQQRQVYKIARLHGGLKAGSENGKGGYQLTYGIAYIRDFVMRHHVLAESFETSVPWSRVLELCDSVKQRLCREHAARNLPGKPFITCRVTQLYETGVCVYFYFAYYTKGVANPSRVYGEMEDAARAQILQSGGSLSHHHGIGKIRKKFLPQIMSAATLSWAARSKQAIDPANIFGCSNLS